MDPNRAIAANGYNRLDVCGRGFDSHRPLQLNQLLTYRIRLLWLLHLNPIETALRPFQRGFHLCTALSCPTWHGPFAGELRLRIRASSHRRLHPRRNACIPAFGKPSALTAGCKPCVRIVVSASVPLFFEWKTRPSRFAKCHSAFIAVRPSESARTTVLYAATFLQGPIVPARSTDSSTRIMFSPMSSLRSASNSPMRSPEAAASKNSVEYCSRLAAPRVSIVLMCSTICNACSQE